MRTRAKTSLQEIEAKCDIPFPLASRIVQSDLNDSQGFLRIKVPQSFEEVKSFYETEMERLGWRLEATARRDKVFYYWRKPRRWCSLVLTSLKPLLVVEDLFIGF